MSFPSAAPAETGAGTEMLTVPASDDVAAASAGAPAPVVRAYMLPGLAVLLLAVPLALVIQWIHGLWPDAPAKAVGIIGIVFGALAALPVLGYVAIRRRAATLEAATRIAILTALTLVVGVTLYALGVEVFFPADFLVWSESDFVNDILKLKIGYPLYSPEVNNESFFYTPGSQILTYFLAALAGLQDSIVALRAVQIIYTVLAAAIAAASIRRLLVLSLGSERANQTNLWKPLAVPVLFLAGTNTLTNAYVQNLHNDALAQLVCAAAFWLLLHYAQNRKAWVLTAMALVPCIGFLVKQSLVIWLPLYLLFLIVFDRPRSIRRIAIFAVTSGGAIAAVLGAAKLIWGEPFDYWIFYALSRHEISALRSIQHFLDAWAYFALGIAGGLVLMRKEHDRRTLGLFLVWALLLGSEAYTSGAAWMLNHMGPGSLIAVVWFLAAAGALLSERTFWPPGKATSVDFARAASVFALAMLLLAAMSAIRVPLPPLPRDARRYVAEIEREFEGQPRARVLLDVGSWVYVPDRIVMRDRAPSIGERGYSASGDFSGMLERLRSRQYVKILVREPDAPDSWYDHESWPTSSGIRDALRENYREVRTIAGVMNQEGAPRGRYTFRTISVLVPKPESTP